MNLTKSELEVMHVLWKEDRPLSRAEIINLSTRRSWKEKSIHILLNGLLKKGAICEAGYVRCEKVWGRTYAANISCEEYYKDTVFADSNKAVLPMMFSALLHSEEVTPDNLQFHHPY